MKTFLTITTCAGLLCCLSSTDARAGAEVRCKPCHSLDSATKTKVGPPLKGILGSLIGSAEGFRYGSGENLASLGQKGAVWTEATLRSFLEDPRSWAQNHGIANRMPKVSLPGHRLDEVISYFKIQGPAARPPKASAQPSPKPAAPRFAACDFDKTPKTGCAEGFACYTVTAREPPVEPGSVKPTAAKASTDATPGAARDLCLPDAALRPPSGKADGWGAGDDAITAAGCALAGDEGAGELTLPLCLLALVLLFDRCRR